MKRSGLLLALALFLSFVGLRNALATPYTYVIHAAPGVVCNFSTGQTITANDQGEVVWSGDHPAGTVVHYSCTDGQNGDFSIPTPPPPPTNTPPGCTRPDGCPPVTDTPVPPLPTPTGQICTGYSDVIIRQGPSTTTPKVGNMAQRQNYNYYELSGGWYRIDGGWVSSQFVQSPPCNATPVPTPGSLDSFIRQICPEFFGFDSAAQAANYPGGESVITKEWCQRMKSPPVAPLIASEVQKKVFDASICGAVPEYANAVPEFMAWLNNLSEETRRLVDIYLGTLEDAPRCQFIWDLIHDGKLGKLPASFSVQNTIEMITAACQPDLPAEKRAKQSENLSSVMTARQDITDTVNACWMVQTVALLGEWDANVDQQTLYTALRACPEMKAADALQAVIYAVGTGIDIPGLLGEDHQSFCQPDTLYQQMSKHRQDARIIQDAVVQKIAANLKCNPPSVRLTLIMLLWHRWDELTPDQTNLLLGAADPCTAVMEWLLNGSLPAPTGNTPLPGSSAAVGTAINQGQSSGHPTGQPHCELTAAYCKDVTLRGAVGVFLAKPLNGQKAAIRMLKNATSQTIIELSDAILQPSISPDGKYVAYFTVDPVKGATLWVRPLDGSGKALPAFTDADIPAGKNLRLSTKAAVAWRPSDDSNRLSMFITLSGDKTPEIDVLYLTINGDAIKSDLAKEAFLTDAAAPALSPDRNWLAFIRQGQVYAVAIDPTYLTINAQPWRVSTPGKICLAPAFEYADGFSLLFTCQQGNARSFYNYKFEYAQQPITVGNVPNGRQLDNLAPGPAYGYWAFDDGLAIYFSYLSEDKQTRKIDTLIQLRDHNVYSMRWAAEKS